MSINIQLDKQTYTPTDKQSALDCLLDAGLDLPFGCKAGACQSCIMKVDSGDIPNTAQAGLSSVQKKLNYFLPCCCTATSDMILSRIEDANQKLEAKVLGVERLNESILRIRLTKVFDYLPGQFLSIWVNEQQTRSYSIASTSAENFIELHVKKIAGGAFSEPAYDTLKTGDTLALSGPMGQCVYAADCATEPLLLSGIGTGLAPLYGIAREALDQGHSGKIDIVLGARDANTFYLIKELQELENQNSQVTVHFISQNGDQHFAQNDDIYSYTKALIPSIKDYRIFLCGAESFVLKLRKQCFLGGAAMNKIHADIFTASN